MIQVFIDGNNRTRKIETGSISIQNILTNKRDTAQFNIINHSGESYIPHLGEEVLVYDNSGLKVFGGVITAIDTQAVSFPVTRHNITCQDYTRLLDHRVVPDGFVNKTVNEIITSLRDSYFPDFTLNNVDADLNVSKINFRYKPVSQCLTDLAKLFNYDWYVDYDKDLHFFAKETVSAPFDLNDDDGSYRYDTLTIRRDNSQIRNSIIVRGGDYLASQLTTNIQTDGVRSIYNLPYKFSDFDATLSTTNLNVGIDYIDNPDSFDALHNFQEKQLKFKDADKPSASKTLKVSGKPNLPIIVRVRSSSLISSMSSAESTPTFTSDGVYDYYVEDKTLTSKEAARKRAQAEILAYGESLVEGEFVTELSGLRAGQAIFIDSASRGISETFIINKVQIGQFSANDLVYKVSLITTRTMDLVDVLQQLLLESNRKQDSDVTEASETIISLDDSADFSDSLGTFSTHGNSYRYGPSSDTGRYNFAKYS